jgi:hypothetical protein
MSRHRSRITKMNRRTERARARRERKRQQESSPVKIIYDRNRGIGEIPINLMSLR